MLRLYTHPACLDHDTGPGHAESPARLRAVLDALSHERFAALERVEAPRASREQLLRVHSHEHLARVLDQAPEQGLVQLDEDTVLCAGSAEAGLRAAGAVIAAVDAVMTGECGSAFCAVRPPGHHATREKPMGFCLFNSVAAAAAHALALRGLKRVAIVDFDVHHGNGTQDIFADEPRVLYASSHQTPLYPGTGLASECGVGNIVNAPLPPGTGSGEFRRTWENRLLPRLHDFRPQLVLISAGFDAHRLDPLAQLQLDTDDYSWLTAHLVQLANAHAHGRLVSSLEGGYDLNALEDGVCAHVSALSG